MIGGYMVDSNKSSLSVEAREQGLPTANIKMEFDLTIVNEHDAAVIREKLATLMGYVEDVVLGRIELSNEEE
ncbi:hypothetical protein [Exiguobacterium sp. s183]|uniref:hypothetical protein n=1 Tax=Exiguobacterium sp. s183 TaxID=2751262 RepID=UPI001BE7886C|nr:hypothetical protein [Exiguobacterium sp. s183]